MSNVSRQTRRSTDQIRANIIDDAIEQAQSGSKFEACSRLASEFQANAVPQNEAEQLAEIFGTSVGLPRPTALAAIHAAYGRAV